VPRPNAVSLAVLALALGIAAVRITHCALTPVNTTDIVRHLFFGQLVFEQGLASAGESLVAQHCILPMAARDLPWSDSPYPYPPVPLGFFTLVAAIWPTLFFAKLALTTLEAVAAALIARRTRDPWLGLLYWANPVSIWWISREGQFEALQNVLVVLALLLVTGALTRGRAFLGGLALAAAIQVKLIPLLLLPWFLSRLKSPLRAVGLAGLAVGLIPSLVASQFYPVALAVAQHSSPLTYNPYYWNPFDSALLAWNPWALRLANAAASYGLLLTLAWRARRGPDRLAFLAPLGAIVAWKLHTNVQFWYMVALPPLLLPIADTRLRRALFILAPLLDVYSISEMILGPWGAGSGGFFRYLSVFDPIVPACF
jgi:hypothetical protein